MLMMSRPTCTVWHLMPWLPFRQLATGALVAWMSSNPLRLNPSKTQYIWLGARQQLAKLDLVAMALRFPHIAFSLTVRDLGLTLDQQLTFAPHINRLCRDCYYQLRQLRIGAMVWRYWCHGLEV